MDLYGMSSPNVLKVSMMLAECGLEHRFHCVNILAGEQFAVWKQALKEYEQPAMDPAIREALDAYVEQRRAEIGSGEP